MKQKSNAWAANWPNTISALREKKEKDRIAKLEAEEIERRKIDAIEEALQNEMRNETIKKANEKMWEEQDRVKALRSKMLMSDVLAERKEQEKLKRRKQQFQDAIDKEWDEQER